LELSAPRPPLEPRRLYARGRRGAISRQASGELRDRGIHVGHTAIGGSIAPDGDHQPDDVADVLWRRHAERGDFQVRLGIN
jgi:hypothetical protein